MKESKPDLQLIMDGVGQKTPAYAYLWRQEKKLKTRRDKELTDQ